MLKKNLSPEERTLKTSLSLGCRMFQVGRQTDVYRVRGFLPCKRISWKRNGVFAQIWEVVYWMITEHFPFIFSVKKDRVPAN